MALQELQCRPHAAHAEGLAAPLDRARRPHSVPGIAAGLTQVHREVRPEHAQRTEFTADPTLQHGLAIPEVIWPRPRRHQGSIDDAGAQQGPGQQRPTTAGRLWHQGAGDAGVNDGQLKHG